MNSISEDIRFIKREKGKGIEVAIKDSEIYPLSGADVKRIANEETNVIAYEDLENVNNIDEILDPYGAVIILYQTSEDFGHWVSLFRSEVKDDTLVFYDSYGLTVDEELNTDNKFHLRVHKGEIVPHLSSLIDKSNYKVINNKEVLQSDLSQTNTCGRYAALRVRFRDLSNKNFNSLLTKNKHYDSDFWVSSLTLLI